MPYKLLVELKVRAQKFKSLLKENEVPRGIPAVVEIYGTNIDDKPNPESKTSKFMFEGRNYTTTFGNFTVPKLEPNRRTLLHRVVFSPYEEGITWVVLSVEPVNNEPFTFFYFLGSEERKEWRNLFYVVNREMLNMSLWLERLSKGSKQLKD